MDTNARIFVAGPRGLVGSALVSRLHADGYENLLLPSHDELDLIDQKAVEEFFDKHRPTHVFVAAARVGGIHANAGKPVEFLYENLMIAANVIHAAALHGTQKLLFLGSSCIYPRAASQPMQEDSLLTGPLEPTNEAYAIAKIAGLKLCEYYNRQYGRRFISAMPTNLYGPGDNFHPDHSHVIPGMMRRFHEAKAAGSDTVTIWGSGTPRREFLHVTDLADALILLMNAYDGPATINIGTGEEVTIRELGDLMAGVTGFGGTMQFDTSRPDGSPRKLLDSSRLRSLGWSPSVRLQQGLASTYEWARRTGVLA